MFGRKKTVSFREAVEATHWLLAEVGERHWALHFAKHRSGNTEDFRSVYGGMGSFNDLVICQANHHDIDSLHESFANQLLKCLGAICYETSQRGDLSAHDAVSACGSVGNALTGWRCRDCGYSQVSAYGILTFAAYYDVRRAIDAGIEGRRFLESIQAAWNRVDQESEVARFKDAVFQAGIHFVDKSDSMRPCPRCGSENTCVYRWDFDGKGFWESPINLSVRKNL